MDLLRQQIVFCCQLTQFQRVCRSRGLECMFKEADLRVKPNETSRVIHSDRQQLLTRYLLWDFCNQDVIRNMNCEKVYWVSCLVPFHLGAMSDLTPNFKNIFIGNL